MSYHTLSKQSLEKLPPHDIEAEQAILSAILQAPQVIPEVLSIMEPGDFYRPSHTTLFNVCQQLATAKGDYDLIVLRDSLEQQGQLEQVGDVAYLVGLVDVVPTAANVAYHAQIVREKSIARRILNHCVTIATKAYDDSDTSQNLISEAKDLIDGIHRLAFDKREIFWRQSAAGIAQEIELDRWLRFLIEHGFYMIEVNEVILFVRKHQNILQENAWVKSTNKSVKDMIKAYCQEQDRRDVWRIVVEKNKLFTTATLTGLDTLGDDFYRDTQDTCTLFFQNGAIQITATSITWQDYNEIPGYIWEDAMSPRDYHGKYHRQLEQHIRRDLIEAMKARDKHHTQILRRVLNRIQYHQIEHHSINDEEIFDILKTMAKESDEAQDLFIKGDRIDLSEREAREITILYEYIDVQQHQTSEYQRFLEYVSAENVEEYTGKTLYVNNLHVFEYALAYLIHHYNSPANMRAVILADSNPSFVSNGRRGKKIILDMLKYIRGTGCTVKEDGKAFNNGQFKFQLIRPNTKILILDDVAEDFDFKWMYSAITDGMVVEAKGSKRIAFSFEDTPKVAITTNHPCYDEDISSSERAILLPISDYFIKQGRTPYQVFGHMLYDDWEDEEWDRAFDYIIGILQRYLQRPDPSVVPITDLTIFNANKLLLKVPEVMVNYLDDLQKDKDYEKETLYTDLTEMGLKFRSSHEFSKLLHTYCRLRGYKLKSNSKDGRYIVDQKQYVCIQPMTLELPGLKYTRKPRR